MTSYPFARAPRAMTGSRRSVLLAVDWMRESACATRPDLAWVADHPTLTETTAMESVCGDCHVLDACAAYVRDARIVGGFWAGHPRSRKQEPVQEVLFGQAG